MSEIPLPGGFVNAVVRVADTVRRVPGPRAAFVHELLRLFERRSWAGAPRFLGLDERDREILRFVDGHVAWEEGQPAGVTSDESLARVGALVREFHDVTAGTPLAGDAEVVCHNDLSPKNTVYRDGGAGLRPVAFIDWDLAAPGRRVHDVGHACWQYAGLAPGADPGEAARRVRVICDGYGLADRGEVVGSVLWWQDRCRRGIEADARAGLPHAVRLRADGVVEQVRAAHDWVAEHRALLERDL
ncbi:phosphotransferase [Nonomuraea sp. PA05]|uniref:phosphotransferase n=1 Tax=Nonomuraea sp. PA05 TaxID=2604466 RepID=UPI0011D7FEE8|nr:phosphotransferase [Nonomuraea sp. PA05]TYB66125.1 phosphotransferase [Nonomuraea sp. PA05]